MKRRRIVAVSIVLLAGALAAAAPGQPPGLYVEPEVIALFPTSMGSGGSGVVQFRNDSTVTFTVAAIEQDNRCTMTGGTGITVFRSVPFTVAGMGSNTGVMQCPAGGPSAQGFGIRRCLFHATDGLPGDPYASFTGLCAYRDTQALAATPASVDLGTVSVGSQASRVVTIATPNGLGSVYLSVTDQDGNFRIGTPCPDVEHCVAALATLPGGSFDVTVKCTPTRTGPLSAVLHVVGADGQYAAGIGLQCSGGATSGGAINVNPSVVTLAHPVNQGSATGFAIVQNVGSGSLEITSVTTTGSPAWSTQLGGGCTTLPCTLPAMGSASITTAFQPTAIGNADALITITSNDPMAGTTQIALDGLGTGTTLGVALGTPPAIDFGSVPIGAQSTLVIDVRNDPATEILDVMPTATPAGVFTLDQPMFGIAPNSSAPLAITCTPDAPPRTITGTVTLAGSATFGSPIDVAVTCTASGGSLLARPSAVALGEVRVGTTRTVPIELQTSGPALTLAGDPTLASAIPGVSVTAPSSPTITTVVPSTFDLRVAPTADGDLGNTIEVATSTEAIAIPVTGRAVTPSIAVPAELHLGTFCVDQPTQATLVELLADGTATIALPAKPTLDATASPFTIAYTQPVEAAYPYALPAGQRAMVEILPKQQSVAGTHDDVLVWQTDMPGQGAPRTRLTVEYAAAGPAVSPKTADFGGVPRGVSAMTRSITVQNCGTEPVTLDPPRFIPEGEFRDVSPEPLPATLAPSQRATVTLTFLPARTGPRTSRMEIETSGGLLEVDLRGLGLGDDDDDAAKTSFYACGCRTHDPTGVLAIGLGLVLAIVPRRRRR